MEEFRRHERLAKVSFSAHPSSFYKYEKMLQVSRQNINTFEWYKEQTQQLTCYCPSEVPNSPHQALNFLSRTWSPSSSDFFQILSSNNPSTSYLDGRTTELHDSDDVPDRKITDMNDDENSMTRSDGEIITMDPLVARLGGGVLRSFSRERKNKNKDEVRLTTAQVHAALSVTRLAAAIAGVVGNSCYMESTQSSKVVSVVNLAERSTEENIKPVVASAAALVATVCAEAAESSGANREQLASVIRSGLATRTTADLLTLTANAATCLRGAATLELRAASRRHLSENQYVLASGVQLPIEMPQGKVELRKVSIYLKHDEVTMRLGKKHMGGVISTYKEYRIFCASDDPKDCGFWKNRRGCYLVSLATSRGTVRMLFEDQKLYVVWKSIISNLLCDC
ncbi:VAN3-binding protein-like [Zingiber officinale]|uniref:VAN3-binding protein-like n=1 Tax=Zingiber officinale TaxID=94328 RepID=UPI001C4B424E|nr:VAN3-binding protein-like [Zingiber officinale]